MKVRQVVIVLTAGAGSRCSDAAVVVLVYG